MRESPMCARGEPLNLEWGLSSERRAMGIEYMYTREGRRRVA